MLPRTGPMEWVWRVPRLLGTSDAGEMPLHPDPAMGCREGVAMGRRRSDVAAAAARAIPRTSSGTKPEVPSERLLEGEPLEEVVTPGAVTGLSALETFLPVMP